MRIFPRKSLYRFGFSVAIIFGFCILLGAEAGKNSKGKGKGSKGKQAKGKMPPPPSASPEGFSHLFFSML
jgi:hypothetical protein